MKKSRKWATLNLLTCADSSTDTKKSFLFVSGVRCQLSIVTCHVLCVTCHLSHEQVTDTRRKPMMKGKVKWVDDIIPHTVLSVRRAPQN